jgi:type VI secretion system protein ImpJ
MQKLYWHDGLHLCPEHFQSQDTFVCDYIDNLVNLLEPNLWGIVRLDTSFKNNTIKLKAVKARFADGMMVDYEYNIGCYELQALLDVHLNNLTEPFSVYLACATSGQKEDRFLSFKMKSLPVDLSKDERTLESVQTLVPKLRLITSKDQPDPDQSIESNGIRYSVIEIKRFVIKNSILEKDKSFIPPLMNLFADKKMYEWLNNIVEKTRKAVNAQHQRVASLKQHSLDASDLTKAILMYSTLARYLPKLVELLEHDSRYTHPRKTFAVMTQMHNELIALEGSKLDDDIFSYCHRDIFKTFNKLVTALIKHLSRLDMNWKLIPLKKTEKLFKGIVNGSDLRYMKRMVLVGPAQCNISHFFWGSDQIELATKVVQKRQLSAKEMSAYYKKIKGNDVGPPIHQDERLIFECNSDHANWKTIKNNNAESVEIWVYVESEKDNPNSWKLGVFN